MPLVLHSSILVPCTVQLSSTLSLLILLSQQLISHKPLVTGSFLSHYAPQAHMPPSPHCLSFHTA